jgi:hypothetical protein
MRLSLYKGLIDGIFFDEGWNKCGTADDPNKYADVYRFISDNTKRKYPGAYTVLNPGDNMDKCFEHRLGFVCPHLARWLTFFSSDTLMTYEGSYERYRSGYKKNGWTALDTRKIWHIIYDVRDEQIEDVVRLAKERGAGLVHITDGILPNPYNTLPGDNYMYKLQNYVDGYKPAIAEASKFNGGPASGPPALQRTDQDYSSVSLFWGANPVSIGPVSSSLSWSI